MKDASTIQLLFGKNRDALVLNFVHKLKQAVFARKDVNAQQASENFIRDIMKKMDFNKTLKGKPAEREARTRSGTNGHKVVALAKDGGQGKRLAASGRRPLPRMPMSNTDNALQLALRNVDASARERALGVVK